MLLLWMQNSVAVMENCVAVPSKKLKLEQLYDPAVPFRDRKSFEIRILR